MKSTGAVVAVLGLASMLGVEVARGHAQQTRGDAQPSARAQRAGSPARRATPNAGQAANSSDLSVTTYLEKTAVWVGDRFHYQIFVDHPPAIRFIVDNVNKETVNLDPFRVLDVTFSTIPLKNGRERLFVDLTLAAFTPGVRELEIPQLTLFYFRRDAGALAGTSEGAAAESLTVPGPKVGIATTLLPGPGELRDAVTVAGWPLNRWIAAGIGWGALVLLVAGAGWETTRVMLRRKGRAGPDPRKQMAAIRDRWSRAVPADFHDANAVMDFYGRSYRDVKEYLGCLLDTPTAGLMADEVRGEVMRLSANAELAERTARVLDLCETARYAQNPANMNSDAARTLAEEVRRILEVGART